MRENLLWEQRRGGLREFADRQGRMPYFTSAKEPQEKVLATRVTRQRHLLTTGKLPPGRNSALDHAVLAGTPHAPGPRETSGISGIS